MVGMVTTSGKGSMFDGQSTSSGAASSVRSYAIDGSGAQVVPGTQVKMIEIPEVAKYESDGSEEFKTFIRLRTEWVAEAVAAGGRIIDCWSMLKDAGHTVTYQTLVNRNETAKAIKPVATVDPVRVKEQTPDVELEEISAVGRASPETLTALQALIDAAAERMELEVRIEIEELKPKAQKWEQLRKIRDLLPK